MEPVSLPTSSRCLSATDRLKEWISWSRLFLIIERLVRDRLKCRTLLLVVFSVDVPLDQIVFRLAILEALSLVS